MNRKNTIMIAVMVNAGLLAVLFVTALTTQEEVFLAPSTQMAESSSILTPQEMTEMQKPLFGESSDRTLRQTGVAEPKPSPAKSPEPVEVPVLHALPPLAAVEPPGALEKEKSAVAAPALVRSSPVELGKGEPPAAEAEFKEIVVEKGDTLDKIAKANQTSIEAIIKINRLPSSFLRVGQRLKIPTGKVQVATLKPKAVLPKEEGAAEYYTVKVGDNPWTIAIKHNMKVDDLLRLNGLTEEKARKLKPGDRLRTR